MELTSPRRPQPVLLERDAFRGDSPLQASRHAVPAGGRERPTIFREEKGLIPRPRELRPFELQIVADRIALIALLPVLFGAFLLRVGLGAVTPRF